ncbi:addiction module antidote protein [Enterobacter roggenkampii]|nr:addiction module antidote protein [Enterobacter roggenkampii]MBI9767488.1 addiction module antidote protein [Escherichia coli]
MKDRPHNVAMAEHFRAHPTYAAELLAEVCREGNPELAILLRQMVTASAGDERSDDTDTERALPL